MSEWRAKRFWDMATPVARDDGYAIELDGRGVKTPAKAALILPTRAYADAVAAEWMAQEDEIDPLSMPFTRSANAAIDKVRTQRSEVIGLLADYADSDLLCYRAEGPDGLIERQALCWDPALDWAANTLNARLSLRTGIMHSPQAAPALDAIRNHIAAASDFGLAALHDLIMLTGSAVLGLAAARGWKSAEEIWSLSVLDEAWQEEQWGRDEEAAQQAEIKKKAFLHAKSVHDLSSRQN